MWGSSGRLVSEERLSRAMSAVALVTDVPLSVLCRSLASSCASSLEGRRLCSSFSVGALVRASSGSVHSQLTAAGL